MVIKIERADSSTEFFKSENYLISKPKDFHPIICKVSVYDNGKKIKSVTRPFNFIYKHFTFKSAKVQERLKELEKQAELEKQNANKVVENEG